jgi:deoxyribose-phosphate aldolase
VSFDPPSRRALALRLLPLLDLTSLGEDDSPERIERLCAAARTPFGVPAALCVYPEHVTTVQRALKDSLARVATVVNFPDGGSDSDRVSRETRRAIAAGADEIDLVLPYRALRDGDSAAARRVIAACRAVCGGSIVLKLILETGELATPGLIRHASLMGIDAGVDFLKTSTGKAAVNATPAAAGCMLDVIAEHGGRCGFKAAGGIRTLEDAAVYLELAASRLGSAWIEPRRFRIGASALFTELRDALAGAA